MAQHHALDSCNKTNNNRSTTTPPPTRGSYCSAGVGQGCIGKEEGGDLAGPPSSYSCQW